MELRARTRHTLRRAATMAALGALLVPATAGAATAHAAKTRATPPVITSVSPMHVAIGETLTVKGRGFLRGRNKNAVVFKAAGQKAIFVKADIGTAKLLKVKLPAKLADGLRVVSGAPVATRFQLRVLSTRLGRAFTLDRTSPVIGPVKPPAPPAPPATAADGDCDGDGIRNAVDTDADNDGLPNDLEIKIHTDPCNYDSDGDGVSDGFEYRSAVDLNNDDYRNPSISLPYPGTRPYPNPLDGADAGTDFDGDGLSLNEEYKLWQYTVKHGASPSLDALSYSDGLKYSIHTRDANGRRVPALPAAGYDKQALFISRVADEGYSTVTLEDGVARPLLDVNRDGVVDPSEANYYDRNGDGWLSDDERDEDGDGLPNWVEAHGEMRPDWWMARYDRETPFRITYAGTAIDDEDSDGDGIVDGADDQDHDNYPNVTELSRAAVTGRAIDPVKLEKSLADGNPWWGRVQPFNPCEPNPYSRTCPTYVPFSGAWAPFDGPAKGFELGDTRFDPEGDDPNYLVLN